MAYAQNNALTDSDALTYYSNPSSYVDHNVNFTGKILKLIQPELGTMGLQMYQAGDTSRNTIVTYTTPIQLSKNDCVRVVGISQPISEYQNMFGANVSAASIRAENIKRIDCSESIEPAIKIVDVDQTQEQNNIRITLHKIEFSDKNTRGYLTIENKDISEDVTFSEYNSRAIQGKTQFITTNSFDVNYPRIESVIPPGIEESGVVLFEPLDPTQNEMKFRFEANKGMDQSRFTFNVSTHLDYYDRILDKEPNNVDVLYNKGLYLGYIGNITEAVETIDKALKIDPRNDTISSAKEFIIYTSDNSSKIIDYYDRILDKEPNNVEVILNKGEALNALGNYSEAIERYDQALKIDPNNVFVLETKGEVLSSIGNYSEAIETYDKALKIDNRNISILETKGEVLSSIGNYSEAIDVYHRILELDPNNINATLNIGDDLFNLRNFTGANEFYDKVLTIDPSDPTALARKDLVNARIS